MAAVIEQFDRYAKSGENFMLSYLPVAPHYPYDTYAKRFEKFEFLEDVVQNNDYTGRYKNQLLYMDWVIASGKLQLIRKADAPALTAASAASVTGSPDLSRVPSASSTVTPHQTGLPLSAAAVTAQVSSWIVDIVSHRNRSTASFCAATIRR